LIDLHEDHNQKTADDETPTSAPEIASKQSPPASTIRAAASVGDANDSAYAVSIADGQLNHHDKHLLGHETAVEVQSDNEFDDAAEVYDAVGDDILAADEVSPALEPGDPADTEYDGDHAEEDIEKAALHRDDKSETNTNQASPEKGTVGHEDWSTTDDVAPEPDATDDTSPTFDDTATNDDLIDYDDDDDSALPATSNEPHAGGGTEDSTGPAEADDTKAVSKPKDALHPEAHDPKHQSPRGKRRLEDDSEFDFIDFADDEPDVKKARAG
jgi:hypothetical protein